MAKRHKFQRYLNEEEKMLVRKAGYNPYEFVHYRHTDDWLEASRIVTITDKDGNEKKKREIIHVER